uniref:Uncharacterized protein n=1 Tax=Castor canadensis TaxID=51338 RepID=A0A8C0XRN7_CASCN
MPRPTGEWLAEGFLASPRPDSSCHRPLLCCRLLQNMSKSLKKLVEESREKNQPEVDMSDRGISNMLDVSGLFSLAHITQLVLSHNKLTSLCSYHSQAVPATQKRKVGGSRVRSPPGQKKLCHQT